MRKSVTGHLMALLACGTLFATPSPSHASLPAPTQAEAQPIHSTTAQPIVVKMRNDEGRRVIGQMVRDDNFWEGAWSRDFTGRDYDKIRLKDSESGYIPMIAGEGDQDFNHDVVAHIIFHEMNRLPQHMSGAKAVAQLGRGYDKEMGSDYSDTFWFLDLGVLYVVYPMRMYRRHDAAQNTTYLWFEKLEPDFVDPATWERYSQVIEQTKEGVKIRWPPFNSVNEVSSLYGLFMVEPGTTHESRVTFVTKLEFGEGSGWLAKFGSKLPGVIRSGLRNGFEAAVAIARDETEKRAKAAK